MGPRGGDMSSHAGKKKQRRQVARVLRGKPGKKQQALKPSTFHLSDSNVKATGGEVKIYLWLEASTFFRANFRSVNCVFCCCHVIFSRLQIAGVTFQPLSDDYGNLIKRIKNISIPLIPTNQIDDLWPFALVCRVAPGSSDGFCWFLPATHLRALHSSALGPLAVDLTPAAGAEVAARAVPHVAVVVHRALVQAAPLGGGALIAALAGALHLGVALRGATGRSGLEFIHSFVQIVS